MRNTRGQAPAVLLAGLISVALTAPVLANDGVTLLSAARIHTMDPAQPQAGAMAYDRDGTIVAVGTREDLLARYPAATQIDAGNATVIPGLIDAHGHVAGLGQSQMQADLVGAGSKEEVLRRLRAFAADLPDGAWLLGRGWDQNDWPERTFPTAADLDAAFPRRPVWLTRVDGHAGWANSAAIAAAEAAGGRDLSGDWQPDGGRIVRDANDLRHHGVGFLAVNANDAAAYPEDSFEKMREFSRAHRMSFPYLHDEDQSIARAYNAACTPDFFGFNADMALQYRGRLDASRKEVGPPDLRRDLYEAMVQIAQTGRGPREQIASIGCSIKWKDAAG